MTRLGLWNARAAGHTAEEILDTLNRHAKFPVPSGVADEIADTMRRYGRLTIERDAEGELILRSEDAAVLREVTSAKKIAPLLGNRRDEFTYPVEAWARGELKQQLVTRGWPAEDLAGYTPGEPYDIELAEEGWELRDYQAKAVEAFQRGGSGVVVLPCGAGKTIVGAASMAAVGAKTLILVTNAVSARQWRDELLRRTSLTEDEIGEYSGQVKEVKPVTIATYQILTSRRKGEYAHLSLLDAEDWGVIVYDEVHLLPAPVFKLTADLQARRRLGLTATLVREDGREGDVFSLIGPKRYDAAWKDIEAQGFIAPAACFEVRVGFTESERMEYAIAEDQDRYRIAASAPVKERIARRIIDNRPGESVLVIGQYIDQLESMSEALGVPLITGQTPVDERERLFGAFRSGEEKILVVSKVANFSVDLPDASVAIQISRFVRFPTGRGPAPRTTPASEGKRGDGVLLHAHHPRHRGPRFRAEPATLPRRAGLRVHDPRRRPGLAAPHAARRGRKAPTSLARAQCPRGCARCARAARQSSSCPPRRGETSRPRSEVPVHPPARPRTPGRRGVGRVRVRNRRRAPPRSR